MGFKGWEEYLPMYLPECVHSEVCLLTGKRFNSNSISKHRGFQSVSASELRPDTISAGSYAGLPIRL